MLGSSTTIHDHRSEHAELMRTPILSSTNVAALVLAAGFFSSAVVNAAESKPAEPSRERPSTSERRSERPSTAAPDRSRSSVLDDAQRNLLREAMREREDELRKLDARLYAAQKKLAEILLVAPLDENAVRERAEEMAKVQAEQTALRAKVFSVVVPTLKPEQKEQIERNPWLLYSLLGSYSGRSSR